MARADVERLPLIEHIGILLECFGSYLRLSPLDEDSRRGICHLFMGHTGEDIAA